MADDRLIVELELRKESAIRELRKYEEEARRQFQKTEAVRAKASANPNNKFIGNQLLASERALGTRVDNVINSRNGLADIERQLRRAGGSMADEFLKHTLAAGGFISQLSSIFNNVVESASLYGYNAGANNRDIRNTMSNTSSFYGGATAGAAAGFAIGSIIPGVGNIIGAGAGALIGGMSSLGFSMFNNRQKEKNEMSNAWIENNQKLRMSDYLSNHQIIEKSFDRMFGMYARPAKINLLKKRINEIENGGHNSIKNLNNALSSMREQGDTESADYQEARQKLDIALADRNRYRSMLADENMKTYYKFTDPNSMLDSSARMGLYSGNAFAQINANAPINGIDFKLLNNPVVDELKRIRELLSKSAGEGGQVSVTSKPAIISSGVY